MRKNLAPALTAALLAACYSSEAFNKRLDGWVGQTEDALVTSWGPPTSSYRTGSGTKVLQYKSEQLRQWGFSQYTVGCTINMVIGADDKVASYNAAGSACKAVD